MQNRAAEEQKLREGVEAELRRVQGELQQHKARAEQQAAEAEASLADARRALQAAEEKAAALSKDVDDARSATKVLPCSAIHLSADSQIPDRPHHCNLRIPRRCWLHVLRPYMPQAWIA